MKIQACRYPSCTRPAGESGYCTLHERYKPQPRKPFESATRTNDPLYNTRRWRALRAKVLAAHPFCSQCGGTDRLSVHHLIPPKGNEAIFFDEDLLTVLCKACHDKTTGRETQYKRAEAQQTAKDAEPVGGVRKTV